MDGVARAADAEEGARGVEGHAVDARGHAAAAELVELLGRRDGEDTDDGALVGGRGKEGAGVVEGDAGKWGAVGFGDVDGFEFQGVEDENVARCGRDVGGCWGRVGSVGGGQVGGWGFLGERVGEVAGFGGGRQRDDCWQQ